VLLIDIFISCFFVEHSGVEIDLRNRFPSKVFMRNFVRTYIKAGNYFEDTAEDLYGEDFMTGFEVNNTVHINIYIYAHEVNVACLLFIRKCYI
jgi:hypothetical protein